MNAFYPFFISFIIIFLAELGDKTQLLILSFASKSKIRNILLGIAIGTFFSHGIAIILGSKMGLIENDLLIFTLKFITHITFLLLGIVGFIPKRNGIEEKNIGIIKKLSNITLNYIFMIALSIIVGEIGDKTFIASIGLGVEYPNYKISLIAGAVLGMIVSNSIAIILGKFIEKIIPEKYIQFLSNIIFIIFGIAGLIMLFC